MQRTEFLNFSAYTNSHLISSSCVLFLSDLIIMYWKFPVVPKCYQLRIISLNSRPCSSGRVEMLLHGVAQNYQVLSIELFYFQKNVQPL